MTDELPQRKAHDLTELSFRPMHRPRVAEPKNYTLQIAAGVCGGLLAFAAIYNFVESRREAAAVAEFNRQVSALNAEAARDAHAARANFAVAEARKQEIESARWEQQRLKDDERCINRQRFRRVENGWVQIGTC